MAPPQPPPGWTLCENLMHNDSIKDLAKWAVEDHDHHIGHKLKFEWVDYAWHLDIPKGDDKIWIIHLKASGSFYLACVWQKLSTSKCNDQIMYLRKDP
ncbi:hypothetical protein PVL29_012468 [Vitis rotundifolia]|uniref:Uncharacterized protein n=1 Tax=Vitis rotundifolia TaxID=103349 RepID=A0AA38ZJ55_VITRO|nr:hypothetical protein PVL29_012468 [Vitis rotundifolia]